VATAPQTPVHIKVKAIGVDRSVVELDWIVDADTGSRTQDVSALLDTGRKDLVGHWAGSAYPGQPGNTVLVGHNYGRKTKGVFVKLERLKIGKEIQVVNAAGQTFTYEVKTIKEVPWKKKDSAEVMQHWEFLDPNGPERLTLVTCGGANAAPFPRRVYVVAARSYP
jgi:LPXTG-site transpeptidase (sortase) family protein